MSEEKSTPPVPQDLPASTFWEKAGRGAVDVLYLSKYAPMLASAGYFSGSLFSDLVDCLARKFLQEKPPPLQPRVELPAIKDDPNSGTWLSRISR